MVCFDLVWMDLAPIKVYVLILRWTITDWITTSVEGGQMKRINFSSVRYVFNIRLGEFRCTHVIDINL